MGVQTSVNQNPAVAFAGQLADTGVKYSRSYLNGDSAALPFGVCVVQGTADNTCKLPATGGFTALGVVLHTHAYNMSALSGTAAIDLKKEANVVRFGRVWVKVETAVTAGSPAFARFSVNTTEQLGAFRADADTGKAQQIPGMQFLTSADAAGYAVLDINLPAGVAGTGETVTLIDNQPVLTSDTTTAILYVVPSNRTLRLTTAKVLNATGLAADNSNYFNIKVLKNGSTISANKSTQTVSLDAATLTTMTNSVTDANLVFVAGDTISIIYDETGTATLPAGSVTVEGRLF